MHQNRKSVSGFFQGIWVDSEHNVRQKLAGIKPLLATMII